ncbi:MAG: mannose-6-phosphate isomerase [Hyphococcus sp.]|nr:MAG: mannose-6-phosphate isomerase [Marinicaulis sp.]
MSDAPKKLNIPGAFDGITETWSPHVARRVNNQDVRLAKIHGAFEWHHHADSEEAFFVIKGAFTMRFRNGQKEWDVPMGEGDLLVVPVGVEHMPVADEECWIMLIENADVVNTGEHESERTKRDLPEL